MKNKLRKMLSLVLAVVIAMSAISVNTLAATRMNIANGSNQKLYVDWYGYSYNFNGRLNTSTYGQIIKLNVGSSTGQVAYCIQSSKDAWTGDYTAQDYYDDLSRAQKLNLKHALIYGYQGTTNYGYNADTERIATQIVIWNICDGWFNNFAESTAVGIFTEGMSSSMATNVKACYNKIKEQMLRSFVMNIDKFKTLENKLSAAYKNNNLLFIANINTADDYELLTNLQKEDMIIIAEKYQYDIYRKIGIGIISPKDMSFNSCALKCGFSACYLHFAHL